MNSKDLSLALLVVALWGGKFHSGQAFPCNDHQEGKRAVDCRWPLYLAV